MINCNKDLNWHFDVQSILVALMNSLHTPRYSAPYPYYPLKKMYYLNQDIQKAQSNPPKKASRFIPMTK